jgi:hypothetical protein
MELLVVATTEEGTRAALESAQSFAAGLDGHITLLVPQAVPYPEPLECPPESLAFAIEHFRKLAMALDIGLSIHVCICRPGDAVLAPAIPTGVIVVIGGPRGGLRPSREQKLADRLTRAGHPVLFVDYERSVTSR